VLGRLGGLEDDGADDGVGVVGDSAAIHARDALRYLSSMLCDVEVGPPRCLSRRKGV
jgi:hypothetical protein